VRRVVREIGSFHSQEFGMKRILVIDDDNAVCVAIQTLLGQQGCEAVLAESGQLGVQVFESAHFDAVIVDIFMPGMDGLETIKGFRNRAPAVPIVAMSGFKFRDSFAPAPDFLAMASKLGATCCLQKPFGVQQLMSAVKACFGGAPNGHAVEA
jgi:CheY-like chemotaxis protein